MSARAVADERGMGADLAWAARQLLAQPSVLLVSIASMSASDVMQVIVSLYGDPKALPLAVRALLGCLAFVPLCFAMGWYGAERIFFQRRLEARPVTVRHLLGLVKPFCGRFLSLLLLVGLPFTLLGAPVLAMVVSIFGPFTHESGPTALYLVVGAMVVVVDFRLTFVTPALAYSTRSARRAWAIGGEVIRETWPRCLLYVLCPPLALTIGAQLTPSENHWANLGAILVLVPIGLVAKGAIAAFYLRTRGSVGEDGAAHLPLDEAPASLPTPARG